MNSKTGRSSDQFMLRMPAGMRERIKVAAARNNRSMNAEIIDLLELRFPEPGSFADLATELYDLATSMMGEENPDKRKEIADRHSEVLDELRDLQPPQI